MRLAHLLLPLACLAACTAPNPEFGGGRSRAADASPPPDARAADIGGGVDLAPNDSPTATVPGLVLHWRLDEPSGTVAMDSSGRGFHGAYDGDPLPVASANVPATKFPNAACRQFTPAAGTRVVLASTAAVLRPTEAVTVTVWFRSTLVGRADLVSHGSDYFIRYNDGEMEFVRRRPPGSSTTYVSASGPAPTMSDGRWHHAAGVASTTGGTFIYLDGVLVGRSRPGR